MVARVRRGFLSLVLLAYPAGILTAQGTGTIYGNVTDPSGSALTEARVTARMVERGLTRSSTVNMSGAYVLPLLPIGTYAITVEANGFKQFTRRGVSLTGDENVRVDVQLEIGALAESVTVTAEAPLVDSRSSVIGTLIDSRRVTELPINGRNVVALAAILPGIAGLSAPQIFTDDRSGPRIAVSGSRPNQNQLLLDGTAFNAVFRNTGLNFPPPDALQEVKVLTNAFSAEYGRDAGSVFNVSTKSGSNEIHGTLWEFLRNHNLNARNFFAPSSKPKLIQNQFGAVLGGPIIKNRLFLFGSFERLSIRQQALVAVSYPMTEAERAGDFTGAKTVKDPLNGQPFSGNRVPVSRFEPAAVAFLAKGLMPLPTRPDGQYVTVRPQPQNVTSFLIRTDFVWRGHTIDGRYNYHLPRQSSWGGQVPDYLPLRGDAMDKVVAIGDTVALRPNILNQLRLAYNRFHPNVKTLNPLSASDLGINLPIIGGLKIPPVVGITGRVSLGAGSGVDAITVNESWKAADSVQWTKNRHSVKAGFELLKLRYLNRTYFQCMGSFGFTGAVSGVAPADFLLGKPASFGIASPVQEQGGLQTNTYYFAQDDWQVHPRLTLNFGLRYELSPPWVHPQNFQLSFHPGQQSQVIPTAPVGMVYPGDPGVPRGTVETDRNNFAPRFGFAWDPFGNGRTSIRGAYGIFYETLNADNVQGATSQPFRYTFSYPMPYSFSDPLRGLPALPLVRNLKDPQFTGLQTLAYVDPTARRGYVQGYNLNVQREVVKDLVLQVAYVGKLGRKMAIGVDMNPGLYGPGATLGNINSRRVYPGFGSGWRMSTIANSAYNALQVEVTKRYSRSFSLQGTYTFSRSMDMFSGAGIGPETPNVFNLKTQWGPSDFDSKHILSASWIWELPRLTSLHPLVRGVAGNWQFNGLISGRSGTPVNIVIGDDIALSGTPGQRPDVIGNPLLPSDRSRGDKILAWFDRAAFVMPATGTYGNVGRNALRGWPQAVANLALFKSVPLPWREGLRLQFRSEFFNALNRVNLGGPDTSLVSGKNMGRITSAGEARVIQFALKALF